ncbi:PQQ-binding-like beta-propeller repeat protein [Micromonospora sp. D75]|uniref:outer membrane protein assembly factor BamB family protein n=1 Tax=Micromonospora sp. D75 TaxID=2824885 RepID=UPI001B36DECB|nr:PQQ-binding-like beta-propeller repeat protein [Micromonospora sp. D75]MBQ1070512.1 PQQ-binding-like beta-propeller repeat protein [Micromonospora sp. D75]
MTYQHQQYPPPAYPPVGRPGPGGAPPAAPKRRGRVALLVAGGLVAVLAVAAGTAYGVSRLVGGGDDGGRKLRAAWVLDFPELQRNGLKTYDGQDMFGAWLAGDAVVRAQPDGIIAYRLGDGGQAWGVPAPQGASLCAAAQTLADGRGVVALGPADSCDTLVGFDAAGGTQAWRVTFPVERRTGRSETVAPDLSVAAGQVVVRSGGNVLGYSLADGRRLWQTDADRLLPGRDCRLTDAQAAGDQAVVTTLCDGDRGALLGLDPATGKVSVVAEAPLSAGTEGSDAKVLERDGTVVLVPWKQVTADAAITVLR